MTTARNERVGPASRPVAIPDDIDEREIEKAQGRVELPFNIRWSGPPMVYDLEDRRDRARVYEQVLREGTEDDVRRFIRVEQLVDLWDDVVLPPPVRRAWATWLKQHRELDLAC